MPRRGPLHEVVEGRVVLVMWIPPQTTQTYTFSRFRVFLPPNPPIKGGLFKSLRLRPPTPEAYGKTADFGTLCIPGSSQRRDPSAALLSSSDRKPARCIECHADSLSCPLTQLYIPGVPGRVQRGSRGSRGFATSRKHEK